MDSEESNNCLDDMDSETEAAKLDAAWMEEKVNQEEEYEEGLGRSWAEDDYMDLDQIIEEERAIINWKMEARAKAGKPGTGQPFSLAFSGGGIRAAAFQSGVLRQLAEAGRIQDIEYFTACSGGGYIASAFASHLVMMPAPREEEELSSWYLHVVARTIARMQRNAGNFIRDCWEFPGIPEDGSGVFPRICDLPIVLFVFTITIFTGPSLYSTSVLIPLTELVEFYFGYAMRSAFCAPDSMSMSSALLRSFEYEWESLMVSIVLVCLSMVSFTILRTCGVEKVHAHHASPATTTHTKAFAAKSKTLFFAHSVLSMITRLICIFCVVGAFVFGGVYFERVVFDAAGWSTYRKGLCGGYACTNGTIPGYMSLDHCDRFHYQTPWYKKEDFLVDYKCQSGGRFQLFSSQENRFVDGDRYVAKVQYNHGGPQWIHAQIVLLVMCGAFVGAVVAVPFVPWLLPTVVLTIGPVMIFVTTLSVIQFRCFGPLTGQKILGRYQFDRQSWDTMVIASIGICFVTMPFLREIKSIWHLFYVSTLRKSFFHGGQDRTWSELKSDPWCPFLIMTGTVNDYMRPSDTHSISEVSFSALHTGSNKCGYVRTPPSRSLAQSTALTGAGCLDAISLSMQDHVRVRFWLEVLNLSWGDYILFEHGRSPWIRSVLQCLRVPSFHRRLAAWWLHRSITILWLLVNNGLLFCGMVKYRHYPSKDNCRDGSKLINGAVLLFGVVMCLSFFTHVGCLSGLSFSPLIRQIHQATKFIHFAWRPPRMLYVTDGGVQDCTAITQLILRKCERILLVLAASDPEDDLAVLKTTMLDMTFEHKLASFFDPSDPTRDVFALLDDFKRDTDIPYIEMGIRYGWTKADDEESAQQGGIRFGKLWVVKNRLPNEFSNMPIEPLLTEDEIRHGETVFADSSSEEEEADDSSELMYDELGGVFCCTACHKQGCNVGRKFPHLTFTGYMWLTPQLFSSLSRLGYALSEKVVRILGDKTA
eukprot:TRINITY_DN31870_c0_g1_i1.p1 TRINITY_DN31870_c0_g1~~TRINITY_DN31870_c0_g1_i1.p1  ORF type:complete len:985 (-),score=107.33 TRINITY_DN31870_c0_g1_i1:54-3008(-)